MQSPEFEAEALRWKIIIDKTIEKKLIIHQHKVDVFVYNCNRDYLILYIDIFSILYYTLASE